MNARCIILGVTLGFGALPTLSAQRTFKKAGQEFQDAARDIIYTSLSPFRASKRDWLETLGYTAGFFAVLQVDDDVDRWIVNHPNAELMRALKPVRKSKSTRFMSRLGSDSRMLPLMGVFVATGFITNSQTLRDVGYGCISTLMVSSLLRFPFYAEVSRARPVIADGDQFAFDTPGAEWNYHSFFSGHSMNVYGCASYVSERYRLGVAEPLLYAAATYLSFARMADRDHWSSDIYTAAVAGIAVGRTVARRTMRREKRRRAATEGTKPDESLLSGLRVSPYPGGLAVSFQRTF